MRTVTREALRSMERSIMVRETVRIFFHGTLAELQPGDVISPEWSGSVHRFESEAGYAYASSTASDAAYWAELAWNHAAVGDMHVYEVTPLGGVERDPNTDTFSGDVRSTEGFEVVREVFGQWNEA